jgi:hypothetical protein
MYVYSTLNQTYWPGIQNAISSIFSKTCVHTLLMLTYWSEKQHGASIAIINTCVYIHHWIRYIDMTYDMM